MNPRAAAANLAWLAANTAGHRRFTRAIGDVRGAQESILLRTLRRNADTDYGRRYDFATIRTVAEFQERVPMQSYDDLHAFIERIARGERNVLTSERVLLFEPSSGSTRAAKWIPYTRSLQAELRNAIAPWILDLFRNRPALLGGPAYWSITPPITTVHAASSNEQDGTTTNPDSAIPVGFEEDTAYLGGFFRRLAEATLAVPGHVRQASDVDEFRRLTLEHLVRCRELRLVSVWHPSFLSLLVAPLTESDLRQVWPKLRLISCWGDGHAALHLDELRRRFPGVEIQAKGLIATEGIVTIPFRGGKPLAVTSHFFELVDDEGRARPAWEAESGERYSVVITTGGGLYRYRLHDLVEVTDFLEDAPCLRFLGKEDHVSDRFGEKLSEGFVTEVLESLLAPRGIRPAFAMLAPEETDDVTRYVLWIETAAIPEALAERLEIALRANPHYDHCVRLGQLAPVAVESVRGAYEKYAHRLVGLGRRLGDVKPLALSAIPNWSRAFEPRNGQRRSTTR